MDPVSAWFMYDLPKHARDIPDKLFCEAVEATKRGSWSTRWDVQWYLCGLGIQTDFSQEVDVDTIIHWKLIVAKFKRCEAKGLVTGCGCECRGDYELTEKGRELIVK